MVLQSNSTPIFEVTLPWPPSVNNYWRHKVTGRLATVYVSAEGKQYRKAVNNLVMEAAMVQRYLKATGPLRVEIEAYPPDKRRRDLDNILKSLLDALTHAGVWEDDSQIQDLRIYKSTIAGMVKVRVYDLSQKNEEVIG
ncbi:MAG: RusA family crossover junction endodeoxyribonuclease [Betaproteobacteria bacterium]|nr:RusA family crossover junction endodeoxyribonuclease [Betaproteobacteria bacterium]